MNIFITGGTGFLGTALVKRLIEMQHHVYLLARSPKKVDALLQSLSPYQKERVHIVEGELSSEHAGLGKKEMKDLEGMIDVVYHSAAYLSFDENDREKLYNINVNGTKNILELSKSLRVTKFIHVSTAYTLGESNVGYENLYPLETTKFINSYEESKCTAEHMVMSYNDIFDVSIMRPAIIIGDSNTGEADTSFGLYGILRAMELLKKRLSRMNQGNEKVYRLLIDKEKDSHVVPVDYITTLLAAGLTHSKKNKVYNLVNPVPPSNKLVLDSIKEGMDFEAIDLISEEDAHLLSPEEVKVNQPLAVFKDYLNRSIFFHDENTRELLKSVNEEPLQMDKKMLLRIVEGFNNRHKLVTQ